MCGACCRIKDGIVRVSGAEIARIAVFLGMGEAEFIERETEVAPDRKSLVLKSRPDGSCAYLTEDNLCRINPVKPDKCRTFPFEWTNPDSSEVCPQLASSRRNNCDGVGMIPSHCQDARSSSRSSARSRPPTGRATDGTSWTQGPRQIPGGESQ
jgi:Fe-S-cluster containining protein